MLLPVPVTMVVKPADRLHIPTGMDEVEYFHENGSTDERLVGIPTRGRVARLLLGTERDRMENLGRILPPFNPVTVGHVAIAAVMAGCTPAMLRIVLAGAECFLDPLYGLVGTLLDHGRLLPAPRGERPGAG